jgi:hypothetical protein
MKLLDFLGDIKKVFTWLGSPAGQTTISTGEAVVEAAYPPATGIITIANSWLTEIIKTQAIASAAGAAEGSSTQKAAMVISAEGPQLVAYAQQHGLPIPTADQIQKANDALVAFLNAFNAAETPAHT